MSTQHTAHSNQKREPWFSFLLSVCCLLSAVCFLCVFPTVAMACPWCKDALFSPGESAAQSGAAKGYALSIGILLGLPVLMLAVIALAVIRSIRRAKRSQ